MIMKIKATSDIHGYLPSKEDIGKCDVLCICGDIFPLNVQRSFVRSISWFCTDFYPWAESLDCDKVIFIAGNHDFCLESLHQKTTLGATEWLSPSKVLNYLLGEHQKNSKLVYLCNNMYEYKGKTFYGTPFVQALHNWAFYQTDEQLKETFQSIPKKHIDVLLTHQPPTLNDCGLVKQNNSFNYLSNYGNEDLTEVIQNRNISYVISGHIHSGEHKPKKIGNTTIANVSLKDEDYQVSYNVFEFEI